MLFYAITGLINAIGSAFLGAFVYLEDRKSNINRLFGLLCLSITLWSFPYYMWQMATAEGAALFWSRGLMMGAIFIPVTYLHFVFVFLKLHRNKKFFIILSYILAFIFFVLNFTSLFVEKVASELSFQFWPKPGIFFHPFLAMFFIYIACGCFLLFRGYQRSTGMERTQIGYLLLASLIGFPSGATNYFLWYSVSIPPFWNILVIFFPMLTTYAITKHHLFEIRVILTELLVGLIAVVLLFQAFTAPTFILKMLGFGVLSLFLVMGYFLIQSVIREISMRAELETAYTELKKLDDAKSEFLSITSHQLRTPLTAIKGYISMILEKSYGEIPKEVEKPLENVFTSNERLIKLVSDILNISRVEAGRMDMDWEKVSLEELILDIMNELKIKAEQKKLYLKFEKPKEPIPQISIDKTKIRQVILNLIDNSIKYTEKGGTVIKLLTKDTKVRIEVSDTGIGLEKEDIGRLFESFSRGKDGSRRQPEGAGLGLYIAKKFIEMHQGQIWVESEGKGKGSTFYIELPIKQNYEKNTSN